MYSDRKEKGKKTIQDMHLIPKVETTRQIHNLPRKSSRLTAFFPLQFFLFYHFLHFFFFFASLSSLIIVANNFFIATYAFEKQNMGEEVNGKKFQ